jgi:hypothetical protein
MLRDAPMPSQQIPTRECRSTATQVRLLSGICAKSVRVSIMRGDWFHSYVCEDGASGVLLV